jgi:hypothetical protein
MMVMLTPAKICIFDVVVVVVDMCPRKVDGAQKCISLFTQQIRRKMERLGGSASG